MDRIRPGDLVWRTHDPSLAQTVKPFTHRQPVSVRVTAREGAPLTAEWELTKRPEFTVTVESPGPLGAARNRALDLETLRAQFGRLGNTPYELDEVSLDVEGAPFAPASMLNELRRDAVEQLQALQTKHRHIAIHRPASVGHDRIPEQAAGLAELHLLVRTPEQLEAALELSPASITLDYLDLYGLRPSIERVKSSGITARVASPRVLKPGEARIVNFLVSLECQIVVRSSGILHALRERPDLYLIGDFSLNTANSLSAERYLGLGLRRLTPGHDLNAAQVADLARRAGAENIEAVAYQHLPVFHTEHCVFCRFLSKGTSYRDCGRPCEKHKVELRDEKGRAHPVMADVGCRNTVFGAEAQEASLHLDLWRGAGIRHFRLEFVHESGDEVRAVVRAFEAGLDGKITGTQLARELKSVAPGGTTQGSLFVSNGYLTLPVLQ
jgi:putative protease